MSELISILAGITGGTFGVSIFILFLMGLYDYLLYYKDENTTVFNIFNSFFTILCFISFIAFILILFVGLILPGAIQEIKKMLI
jgi:hypothetical protein